MHRIWLAGTTLFGVVTLCACGGPEQYSNAKNPFFEVGNPTVLMKKLNKSDEEGLVNFHFDSGVNSFFASNNGLLSYSTEKSPGNIKFLGNLSFTGNGGNFSWKSDEANEFEGTHTTLRLFFDDIPVESVMIRKIVSENGETWMNGQAPKFAISSDGNIETTEFVLDEREVLDNAPEFLRNPHFIWSPGSKIYFPSARKVYAAWKFTLAANPDVGGPSVPTGVILSASTGELLKSWPLAAHITASMYDENIVATPQLSAIELPSLSGTFMENPYWTVKNCAKNDPQTNPTSCTQTASSTATGFPWAPTSTSLTSYTNHEKYDEVVSYHAVAKAWDWNKSIMGGGGAAWKTDAATLGLTTSKPLTVYVRAYTRSSSGASTYDNAQYLPGGFSGTGSPTIVIGTGWEPDQGAERTLRYLGKDADVTMHEFHHHIIFRSMTSVSGETGAMHEGLADFLTYSITGNNKLGESIVPATYSKGALRAGNITGTVSSYLKAAPHVAGEFWSSVLWEIRTALGTNAAGKYKFDKIVWDAIDLSVSSETYYGFISAMAKATDTYAAANGDDAIAMRKAMFQVFANRGFLASASLDGTLPSPGTGISTSSGSTSAVTTTKTSKSGGICGVVANSQQQNSHWLVAVIMAFTLAIPFAVMRKQDRSALLRNRIHDRFR